MRTGERFASTKESTNLTEDFNVLRARKAFADLEGWVLSEEALTLPEHKVEREIDQRGREVWRCMLQANICRRGAGNAGRSIEVTHEDGQVHQQKERRNDKRKVVSIFGDVQVERTAYTAPGQKTVHPLDEEMQLPERSFSYEMQRRIVDEAVRGPFDEAIESIEKNTGNHVFKRSTEQITIDAAQDFDTFY
ncbi:MAG: hypothetical protein AB1467_07235, partial [Candidatus Diapherotrites archaeon]